jgi:hypothetical protein
MGRWRITGKSWRIRGGKLGRPPRGEGCESPKEAAARDTHTQRIPLGSRPSDHRPMGALVGGAPDVLRHPFSELSEEVLNHCRTVLLLGELVAAEAVHLAPGQPEAAVLGDHLGVPRWAGLVSLGEVLLAVHFDDHPLALAEQ